VTQWLAIAAGGAAGALLRYATSTFVHHKLGTGFPWGTLAVNVTGSLAMGFLYIVLLERTALGPEWRALLLVGLLGAFTTFSTFSIETFNLLEAGSVWRAAANVGVSVILCLAAAWLGVVLGRSL